jgi:probable F420-dependent oxidoreductase
MISRGGGLPVGIGTAVPNCREGRCHPIGSVDFGWMESISRSAERIGYDSVWLNEFMTTEKGVAERYGSTPDYFEPLTSLAYMAAVTERVRFVTATLVLPFHHPLILSRQVATLDAMTRGRVTLGVGLGGSLEQFRSLRGELAKVNRSLITDEMLESLRLLWTETPASFRGQYFAFESVDLWPKPVQTPLPVWVAGDGESIPKRIATFADGWIDSHLSPDEIRGFHGRIGDECMSVGRSAAEIAVARQFYVSVGATRAAAEVNVAESLPGQHDAGSIGKGTDYTVIGTPTEVGSTLRKYVDAGVTEVCAIFFAPSLERYLEQMTLFAQEVIPRLRG